MLVFTSCAQETLAVFFSSSVFKFLFLLALNTTVWCTVYTDTESWLVHVNSDIAYSLTTRQAASPGLSWLRFRHIMNIAKIKIEAFSYLMGYTTNVTNIIFSEEWRWHLHWFRSRKPDLYLFMTNNQHITVTNTFLWSTVMSCEDELILLCEI